MGVTKAQSDAYKDRLAGDIAVANEILAGTRPAQATPGIMTPAERRASIAKAFGARPQIIKRSEDEDEMIDTGLKKGGKVKSKPKASSASKRADGIAQRGKTKGRYL